MFFNIAATELDEELLLIRNDFLSNIVITHDLQLIESVINPPFKVKKGIGTHLIQESVYPIKVPHSILCQVHFLLISFVAKINTYRTG